MQVPSLRITSLADEIYIEDVVVNRGNCQLASDQQGSADGLPALLRYGESVQLVVTIKNNVCNVREASVETSDGTWVVEFRQSR